MFGSETIGKFEVLAWAHICSDPAEYSQQYEGNAQQLTHIENHICFESFLIVFYELDEKSSSETNGKEYAKN